MIQIVEFEWTINGILIGNCLELYIQLIFSFINRTRLMKAKSLKLILCVGTSYAALWTVTSTSPFGICLL